MVGIFCATCKATGYLCYELHRGEPALRKHFREQDQKAAPSIISLEEAKARLRVGFECAIYCNREIFSLTHYPLSHASLTTNKD